MLTSDLAEQLRHLDDRSLQELLIRRPDLMSPPASDFEALAARAASPTSVGLAARQLDYLGLMTLSILHSTDEAPEKQLSTLFDVPIPATALENTHRVIERLFLATETETGWRAIGEMDPGRIRRVVALPPTPPELPRTRVSADSATHSGTGSAGEAIRIAEELLDAVDKQPVEQLRAGGISGRDLRKLARDIGATLETAGLLLEVCFAAGLLGIDEIETKTQWLPTGVFDHWRSDSPAQRWTTLARAWLTMRRQPILIERRDERDRRIAPLGPEVTRTGAPWVRQQLLACFNELDDQAVTPPRAVFDLVRWRAPLRLIAEEIGPDGQEMAVLAAVSNEAAVLGIIAAAATAPQEHGLTSFGRALINGNDPAPVLAGLLPAPVGRVLVQADLTIVAPGPLTPELAHGMSLVAEVESAGSATVYRVTADSLRDAFDAGWNRIDVQEFFRTSSATAIPQTLTYLIDDAARRHGGLRVGEAGAYLRSDDETLIAAALADSRCAKLRLRRLAPTVAVSPCRPETLVATLREAGYAAATEDAQGTLLVKSRRQRRAKLSQVPAETPQRSSEQLQRDAWQAIGHMKTGDERRRILQRMARLDDETSDIPAGAHSEAMVALVSDCIREKQQLWITFIDAQGTTQRRLVRPLSLGAGYVRAEDERNETSLTLALHRIASAALPE
jgi:hypothetical protein